MYISISVNYCKVLREEFLSMLTVNHKEGTSCIKGAMLMIGYGIF